MLGFVFLCSACAAPGSSDTTGAPSVTVVSSPSSVPAGQPGPSVSRPTDRLAPPAYVPVIRHGKKPSPDPEAALAPPPAVVSLASASFGTKLVDGPGRTLYVFSVDGPGMSRCVGACAREWPPARSFGGKPQFGAGVTSPEVGNVLRPDGSEQMTFRGYPLYYYSGDSAPGQSNGHGRSAYGGDFSAQPPAKPAR